MTIKTSGALGMDEIAAEYNGTAPHGIADYFGAPGLPTVGPIAFSDFYGKSDLYTTSFATTRATFDDLAGSAYTTSWVTSFTTVYSYWDPDTKSSLTTSQLTSRTTSQLTTSGWNTTWTTYYTTNFTTSYNSYDVNTKTNIPVSRTTSRETSTLTGRLEYTTTFTTARTTSWSAGHPS